MTHILAIDQGTTSSRAIVFDADLRPVAQAQEEFAQHYPAPGWVEHDPSDLWATVAADCPLGSVQFASYSIPESPGYIRPFSSA